MEVGSGKRQSNHIIVMEDNIKTANSIVIWILLESVITELAQTRYNLRCRTAQFAPVGSYDDRECAYDQWLQLRTSSAHPWQWPRDARL